MYTFRVDPNVTLVSAYFQMKSKFPVNRYEMWIRNFMKIKSNKLIFTDKESIGSIVKFDTGNTIYVVMKKEEFLVTKYDQEWKYNKTIDHEKYHTEDLYKVWAEKTNFLSRAIEMNPYNTEYFVWCDIGCFRKPKRMREFLYWPNTKNMDKKVTFLQLRDFLPKELENLDVIDDRFRYNIRNGGGIIAGHRDYLRRWHDIYYGTLEEFFAKKKFAGKDQCVFAYCILRNPDVCQFVRVPGNYVHDEWFYLEDHFNMTAKMAIADMIEGIIKNAIANVK